MLVLVMFWLMVCSVVWLVNIVCVLSESKLVIVFFLCY